MFTGEKMTAWKAEDEVKYNEYSVMVDSLITETLLIKQHYGDGK